MSEALEWFKKRVKCVTMPGARRMYEEAIEALEEQEKRRWIPVSERLPKEYGEYQITWTTSASEKRFVGDSEYEVTGEWDDKRNDFKGEWLLDGYIKAYPDVKVIAWKPIEEPWEGNK